MERRPLTQPSPSRGKGSGGGEHDRCGSVPSDRCYLDRTHCATWATRRSLVSCSAGANGFPASPEAKPHCGLTASTPSIMPCCPYSLADGETEPMGSTGLACQSCRVAGWALSARASNLAQTIYGWSSRPPQPTVGPGDDAFAADQTGIPDQALCHELRMFDEIGGVADNPGDEDLPFRQFVVPGAIAGQFTLS